MCHCGHKHWWGMVCKWLLVIGGLNWGLVGLAMLFSNGSNWNVVNLLLGSWPTVEGIVYVLVGLSAICKMFGCRCKNCMPEAPAQGSMGGNM